MLVDPDGTPRENNRVFPFGEPWLSFTASNNNEKFTTYQHDNDDGTDLDYAMARYYASRLGRFMTPDLGHVGADPSNPQSWNAYVYAHNDPINSVDPSGLDPSCYVDGIEADCGLASNLLSTGAAEQCPNNLCSFSLMGQYYQYFAAAGGASGYVNFMDLPYLYEWNGQLIVDRSDQTSMPTKTGAPDFYRALAYIELAKQMPIVDRKQCSSVLSRVGLNLDNMVATSNSFSRVFDGTTSLDPEPGYGTIQKYFERNPGTNAAALNNSIYIHPGQFTLWGELGLWSRIAGTMWHELGHLKKVNHIQWARAFPSEVSPGGGSSWISNLIKTSCFE